LATDYAAPGDYDGDLKFDLAVQRPGATSADQATFYVSRSLDGGLTILNWGLSNDLIAPGDYDGDGKTDIAVIREGSTPTSNLVWYARLSSDGGLYATSFGLTGVDLNVQNDYDGDGKTDVAVWRNTTGTFYVQRSSNPSNTLVYQWGAPNDFPVASYDSH
ncbi:MAG: VCBS repeat-containing protein, partial [Pyrinomonadaceae bacterium]